MSFEPIDRTLLWEFGYWAGALRRWYGEGLPWGCGIPNNVAYGESVRGEGNPWSEEKVLDRDMHEYFGLDKGIRRIPLDNYAARAFEKRCWRTMAAGC